MATITARAPETVADRTQTLDVEKLWPDPLACPDWPMETGTRRFEGRRGREGAVEHLERLGAVLNRGAHLHTPTAEDREYMFGKVFRAEGSMFLEYGIANLSALDRLTEDQARLVVQAAHARGYIRKCDALAARAAESAAAAKVERARKTVDGFTDLLAKGRAELTELAEAEARHRQAIEDERAFARCNDIRKNLRLAHGEAVMAAHELGVEPPAKPTFF